MKIYKKVFSELRYPGQIDIYDGRANIVKLYHPEKFKHWAIEKNSIIRLHNTSDSENSTESMLIEHKRFIYSYEDPPTDNFFYDKIISYHKMLTKMVPIQKYIRIGIRAFVKIGYVKLEDFISKSKSGLLFSEKFSSLMGETFEATDLFTTLENNKNRLNLGPMKKDETNRYTKEFVVNDNMEDDYILLDIDCFENDLEVDNLVKEYKRIYDRFLNTMKKIEDYFEEEYL